MNQTEARKLAQKLCAQGHVAVAMTLAQYENRWAQGEEPWVVVVLGQVIRSVAEDIT